MRISVFDPQPVYCTGLRHIFERVGMRVETGCMENAVAHVQQAAPHVALITVEPHSFDGLLVVRALRVAYPALPIVVLCIDDDDDVAFHAVQAGAAAYVPKACPAEQFIAAVRRCAAGERPIGDVLVCKPAVRNRVMERFRAIQAAQDIANNGFLPLTAREVAVLDCVVRGFNNGDIATVLSISCKTVKNHLTSIFAKLGVPDRTRAVVVAVQHGWVPMVHGEPRFTVVVAARVRPSIPPSGAWRHAELSLP